MRGYHRWPADSFLKEPVVRKASPSDDVNMKTKLYPVMDGIQNKINLFMKYYVPFRFPCRTHELRILWLITWAPFSRLPSVMITKTDWRNVYKQHATSYIALLYFAAFIQQANFRFNDIALLLLDQFFYKDLGCIDYMSLLRYETNTKENHIDTAHYTNNMRTIFGVVWCWLILHIYIRILSGTMAIWDCNNQKYSALIW